MLAILFVGNFAACDHDGVLRGPAGRLIRRWMFQYVEPGPTPGKRECRQNEGGRKRKDPQTKPHAPEKSPCCGEAAQQRLPHSIIEVWAEKANGLASQQGNSFIAQGEIVTDGDGVGGNGGRPDMRD